MSVTLLRQALENAGVRSQVESLGRLAVLRPDDPRPLADEGVRRAVLRLAAEYGFSHIALELTDDGDDAASLRRDQSSA